MSADDGLPAKALVGDTSDRPRRRRYGQGRALLVVLIAVELAWVAALVYGFHRAVGLIG